MAFETIPDIVSAGVEAQALIDKHLAKAYSAAETLIRVTERGVEEGMIQGIEAKTIIGDARAAAGIVGAAAAAAFGRLHRLQTDACVAAGVDLGSVTNAGGVTIGGVSVMGGAR